MGGWNGLVHGHVSYVSRVIYHKPYMGMLEDQFGLFLANGCSEM